MEKQRRNEEKMTKIDVVSGFLGAGKTTLIKKLVAEALKDTKVVLIENEFGEIGIDGGFLKEAGIEIKEMNSGCICCSLVGDFGTSLKEVLKTYSPERILIEPSGVGKLSDVMKAVQNVIDEKEVMLNSAVAVVDASKCKMYLKNFGEFFVNQIEYAGTIILSRTGNISEEKLNQAIALITIMITQRSATTIMRSLTSMTMRKSMSIITIMRRNTITMIMKRSMTTIMRSIITMIMRKNMTIIMSMGKTAPVDAMIMITIITTMQTKCSEAGEWKRPPLTARLRSSIFSTS